MCSILGTMHWAGMMNGYPAIVVTYHGGASLWIFEQCEWRKWADGATAADVIPHTCEKCGTALPFRKAT
jgi:hypothetical protein